MDTTPNLTLPYIAAAQAQKHVTHNEAIRALDVLVQLSIVDQHLTEAPSSPVDGARYIVALGATGTWANHDLDVAAWQDGAWAFYQPQIGWRAWVEDENLEVAWNGSTWVPTSNEGGSGNGGGTNVNPTDLVGVNATADTTNRLSVKSEAILFSHDDITPGSGDVRHVLNKSTTAKNASILFQTGYSGRAEFGTTGDDDFHIKVSTDGSTWTDAMLVNGSTGIVSFPAGTSGIGSGNVPDGGATGEVLTKNTAANQDFNWATVNEVPTGGATGQALVKNSATPNDTGWSTVHQVPEGGTTGQVLAKSSNTNHDATWVDQPAGGSGDVTGPVASTDSEIALFSSTTGKIIKRATTTGVLKATSGVLSSAQASVDFAPPTSGTALLKGDNTGGFANAVANTDYTVPATLASYAVNEGASLIGIQDAGGLITATNVEGALAENRIAINAADASISTIEADLTTAEGNISSLQTNAALKTVTNTFTKPQIAAPTALSHNTAWDGNSLQHLTINVNGSNFTIANPSAQTAGTYFTVFVTYTTSHSLVWGSNFRNVSSITSTATAGTSDHFVFRSNGTNLHCVGYALNTGA